MRATKIANGMGFVVRRIERLERLEKNYRHKLAKSHQAVVNSAYQFKYYTEHRSHLIKSRLMTLVQNCLGLQKKLKFLSAHATRQKIVLLTDKQTAKLMELIKKEGKHNESKNT